MRKTAHVAFVVCLILGVLIGSVGLLVRRNILRPGPPPIKQTGVNGDGQNVSSFLFSERVVAVKVWDVSQSGDEPFLCVVQAFDDNPHYEGRGEKLTIFDKSGAALYEDYFTAVEGMELSGALRKAEQQLLVSVNYGGNTVSFLQMLDYQDGRIVKVPIEGDGDYDSSAPQVRPQFRRDVTPAIEPYQVMLTRGVGLASPSEKYTEVYRYRDGKYHSVGKFNQHDVDDYIEKLLKDGKVGGGR